MPCPPPETPPPAYADITVDVYNSTTTAGLGAQTGKSLTGVGLTVEEIGNAPDLYYGSALITVGPSGIPAAYALAALIPEAQVKVVDRESAVADITIGAAYQGLAKPEDITLDPDLPIPAPDGCSAVAVGQLPPDAPAEGSEES
nr:LytR C-terminal domain-containing protein [Pseudactinotalea sp. HY160]